MSFLHRSHLRDEILFAAVRLTSNDLPVRWALIFDSVSTGRNAHPAFKFPQKPYGYC